MIGMAMELAGASQRHATRWLADGEMRSSSIAKSSFRWGNSLVQRVRALSRLRAIRPFEQDIGSYKRSRLLDA